jgi:Trp operon repressor
MEENKQEDKKVYRPLVKKDEDYHLAEMTGGKYEKAKMIILKSSTTSTAKKMEIIREFRLDNDAPEDKKERGKFYKELMKAEYSVREMYENLAGVLFIEPLENPKFDVLNLKELNRAIKDFFQ